MRRSLFSPSAEGSTPGRLHEEEARSREGCVNVCGLTITPTKRVALLALLMQASVEDSSSPKSRAVFLPTLLKPRANVASLHSDIDLRSRHAALAPPRALLMPTTSEEARDLLLHVPCELLVLEQAIAPTPCVRDIDAWAATDVVCLTHAQVSNLAELFHSRAVLQRPVYGSTDWTLQNASHLEVHDLLGRLIIKVQARRM